LRINQHFHVNCSDTEGDGAMPAKTRNPVQRLSMVDALNHPQGDLAKLAKIDADIRAALKTYGPPRDRSEDPGFATLARVIIGQQISTKAAAAVWKKICAAGYHKSKKAARARLESLRAEGLSLRKAEYLKGLAEAIESGSLDLDGFASMEGPDITKALVAIRGIGDWTADNYRLFVLADMDAWPYNDLAMQEGMKILKSLNTRPDAKTMQKMGEAWRPHRGAGALMLWHVYAQHRHAATIADIKS
jgi:DNA-3-methyladenine glycosylase II